MRRALRLLPVLLACLAVAPHASPPQRAQPKPPDSLLDPRLDDVRAASVAWENRAGPARRVVDQVCLVPDVATFLAVVATWDRERWFPVLLDDTEFALKFLRAFQPARVVRYPKAVAPVAPDRLWDAAVAAVGRSWAAPGAKAEDLPAGDQVFRGGAPPPPGVVVSAPASPTLAGAVALAAGRFQPLLRWEPSKGYKDTLTEAEGRQLADDLERRIIGVIPKHAELGDDCDFITLAGDYPYRAEIANGEAAGVACFDDGLARTGPDRRRWAFAGRLVGDQAAGAYQAMCSLFLAAESASLFNAYGEKGEPWSDYAMQAAAARRLAPRLKPRLAAAPDGADLDAWHRLFDRPTRPGVALINTSGSPTQFNLPGGPGLTGDVPRSEPLAVLIIHSFSAADPANPDTIAGRWLANGAFAYFGSVNEPYLQSFRTPALVADLIAEGLPFVVACRQSAGEFFGFPWRLIYVGDPFARVDPQGKEPARVAPTTGWPAYQVYRAPAAGASDDLRVKWALFAAFATAARRGAEEPAGLVPALLAIRPERLSAMYRRPYAALLTDRLWARNLRELRARLAALPLDQRTPDMRRWLESACVADIHRALVDGDIAAAGAAWADLIASDAPFELKAGVTERIGRAAKTPSQLGAWHRQLRSTLARTKANDVAKIVRDEHNRVGKALGADVGRRP